MTRYSRQDALRILRIQPKHLRAWEHAGLLPFSDSYSFQDLVQLRKLRDLRATRLSAASIRAGVDAMQAVSGMANPLVETGAVRSGSHLAFRHSGAWMEPISRQFVFDFDGKRRLIEVETSQFTPAQRDGRISALFVEAVRCEEASRTAEAIKLYESILDLDAGHAPSAINLGTIFYNQRQFLKSEQLYRRATEADPGYALAFFDLGNVLDELQRLDEAIAAYRTALQIVPKYADAHYNLALAYERKNERRKALKHWMAYLKLDAVGPWANHARGQAKKILEREKLSIVWRRAKCCTTVPGRNDRCCKA
ncbi:tetratricopeptide (TPR) repeat protein [Silvibacterium bohemicum]|uniref:Tetratricopeptide (TPR) repeat protein n=1 Tax=Silvibacterium bohemicum TaxID=1577686 RepID=A0A841JY77_9BACT|nr:tetratricopeptide repeat protein [Silvibacterium bohemicum]MBB6146403.1 tetratricopeptide (TPR) repeat protein [Silvibacterium bohemicum]